MFDRSSSYIHTSCHFFLRALWQAFFSLGYLGIPYTAPFFCPEQFDKLLPEPSTRAPELLSFHVCGPAGEICSVEVSQTARVADLKAEIQNATGIDARSQRLVRGLQELRKDDSLESFNPAAAEDLTLVRRSDMHWHTLEAVERDWRALECAPAEFRADREVVLAAVAQNGRALLHVAEELQSDREIVLLAVTQDWRVLQNAPAALRADREIVGIALAQDGLALQYASEDLRADRDLVLSAMAQNWRALQYADKELQADHDLVRAAVAQDWRALGCVPAELRADHETMLTALSQSWQGLLFGTHFDIRAL